MKLYAAEDGFSAVREAKKELSNELDELNPGVDWEGVDLKELNELAWERLVKSEMKRLGKKSTDIAADPKGAGPEGAIAKAKERNNSQEPVDC